MKRSIMSRLSAALLAFLMLPLAACANEAPDDAEITDTADTTVAEVTTAETAPAETARSDAKDNLPADLKLNGETITIMARNSPTILNFDVIGTDNSGEIVYDAVWERNRKISERLDVNLEFIPSQSTNLNDLKKEMQKVVMAASGDYDMFITSNNSIIQYGMISYLRVFNNAPYLDFDAPWWWTESMKDVALDGETIQYLIGDMLLNNILRASVVFVNKNIWEDNFGDPEKIYAMVDDNTWTLDKFGEYSKKAFKDVNGDGKADKGDIVGFYGNEYQTIDFFIVGSDVFIGARGDNGYVTLNPPSERAVTVVEKLINLFYNENAAMITPSSSEAEFVPGFSQGRCLFLPTQLTDVTRAEMRDMEDDYAIIPVPKYDETQENYITRITEASTNISVPLTVNEKKFASVCAVLEGLCAESYRSVTEKFYEVALKGKYSRDSASARMLDLILSTGRKELSREYSAQVNDIHRIFHFAVSEKNIVVASYFDSRIGKAQAALDKLVAELQKIK